ncbi:hypothetical protein CC1G_13563 [Coprinopsis cinerea okayama7|uniref:Nucleotidyl transferase AbiEii/AbiGii toxin family protein n=1 Tax=Coprinopsis cinerea (strain Okayama-7 / 130 / ATCC MYA-4618 / FGSC 9003) TaxID=240176 RepID=D6RK32_COPC7|nr:hypothetical protein CC1G_13563 [Coprinopsis cinerea okayama7\|eukprot:XP_002912035.1 hypothetical protein CC1G_13563 [Coprinopsis cinerea okayama7\
MSSSLTGKSAQLLNAAVRFYTAYKDTTGGKAILMGGAATILLGNTERHTKDLDFNVSRMTHKDVASLNNRGIYVRPTRDNRFAATIPESTAGAKDAISIDLAVKSNIDDLLQFTEDIHGVRVADERLLIVDKIICLPQRHISATQKIGKRLCGRHLVC